MAAARRRRRTRSGTASKPQNGAHVKTGAWFCTVGLIIIVLFSAWMISESRYDEKYDKVTATIDEITSYISNDARDRGDLKHSATISYDYNGVHYDNISPKSFNSSMHEGKKLEIYLDPADPYSPILKASKVFFYSFIGIGTFVLLIGVSIIGINFGNNKKRLVDRGQGERIYATVVSAGYAHLQINEQRTYRVIATWNDPEGVAHEFKSKYLYFDPSEYINEGDQIEVYVDPKNYKKYYMCAQELYSEEM